MFLQYPYQTVRLNVISITQTELQIYSMTHRKEKSRNNKIWDSFVSQIQTRKIEPCNLHSQG